MTLHYSSQAHGSNQTTHLTGCLVRQMSSNFQHSFMYEFSSCHQPNRPNLDTWSTVFLWFLGAVVGTRATAYALQRPPPVQPVLPPQQLLLLPMDHPCQVVTT
uniref:Uncharacterized protein n=1 Tax=Oryza glaberrima TaxID=4538 RepID=I1P1D5_ORYGL